MELEIEEFDKKLNLIKEFNGKQCPYETNDEIINEEILENDDILPIVKNKIGGLNFASKFAKLERNVLLKKDKNTNYESVIRTCYLKDTIIADKKKIFGLTTTNKIFSTGNFGQVSVFYDKIYDIPLSLGKYVLKYNIDYNELYIHNTENFDIIHEILMGLELVNRAKYFLPNYPFTYGLGYCNMNNKLNEKCVIGKNIDSENVPMSFIEFVDNSITLDDFIREESDVFYQNFNNVYLQLFNALNILYMINGFFTHYDLHTSNVLIKKLETPILIPIYIFNKKEELEDIYYIKTNFVVYIIDYGLSTYLSYESLLKEYNHRTKNYNGMKLESIRKDFIYGNRYFEKTFNSYEQDHTYDIYKIIGFSIHNFCKKEHMKNEIKELFGNMLGYLFKSKKSSIEQFNDFVEDIYESSRDLFRKPEGVYNRSYNYFVKKLFSKKNSFSKNQVKSDKELLSQLYYTCLDKECLSGSEFGTKTENKIHGQYENDSPKLLDVNKIKKILLKRRESIKSMLMDLKNNPYDEKIKNKNKINCDVNFIKDGSIFQNYSIGIEEHINGNDLYNIFYNDEDFEENGNFFVYCKKDDKKLRIYENLDIINLHDGDIINVEIIENPKNLKVVIFNENDKKIGGLNYEFYNQYITHKKLYKEFIGMEQIDKFMFELYATKNEFVMSKDNTDSYFKKKDVIVDEHNDFNVINLKKILYLKIELNRNERLDYEKEDDDISNYGYDEYERLDYDYERPHYEDDENKLKEKKVMVINKKTKDFVRIYLPFYKKIYTNSELFKKFTVFNNEINDIVNDKYITLYYLNYKRKNILIDLNKSKKQIDIRDVKYFKIYF